MIAYIIGYLSLVVVPLLCVWYVSKKWECVPQFRGILKRASIVASLAIWGAFELCNLTQSVGLHPSESTDYLSAAEVAFWAAGLPEEVAKLVVVALLLWWNHRKGLTVDTKMIFISACMVGALFGMYENLLNPYPYVGKFFLRHWAFAGHFCYAVMMGYGCSLFLNLKSKKLYARTLFYCLLLPTAMHACDDFCVFTLPISTGLWWKAMFLFGYIVVMTANIWIARRCIKSLASKNSKPQKHFLKYAQV